MPGAYLMGWVGAPVNTWVRCKVTGQGKLIIDPTAFLENPPTEDQALKAPTSEWAYDHWKKADAHHAKYTDAEAVAADNNRSITITTATVTDLDVTDVSIIYANTVSGGVYFYGLSGGVDGQIVTIVKYLRQNQVRFYDNSTSAAIGDRIQTSSDVNEYLFTGSLGSCRLFYKNSYWISERYMLSKVSDIIQDTPVNGVVSQAITLNWAWDHLQLPNIHHTKYTDAQAAMASYAEYIVLTSGTYHNTDVTGVHQIKLDSDGGDIILQGLSEGVEGQIIFFVNSQGANDILIESLAGEAAASDRIVTYSGDDEQITALSYGSFYLIYNSGKWWVNMPLTITI